ncbi:dolichyl-diphosphooligosaccharide--protein glycosyltransferase subunit 1-like [Aphidius gifuensis]|uniref:dolichyl-diphosphooligosaccharide--protein glycosyltransferase subunit 1-like n=1 Tax=Aphidius gifuensis TaxID=684658 RepID=UPI001CDCE032|nr:dolichyl-diphosphooligosaccharide--protein glycosyltransferase subunit 1-like [Aphidius gifuensis]
MIIKMSNSWWLLFNLVLLLNTLNVFANNEQQLTDVVLKNVDRIIDLQSQLTKITTKIVIENSGKTSINNFLFTIESPNNESLSFISAQTRDASRSKLDISKKQLNNNIYYEIILKDSLQSGRSTSVEIETISTHQLEPYPKEITQKEKQLVKYNGNIYLYSPYYILKQTTHIILPSRNIESFTKLKPYTSTDTTITYGPFDKRVPFSKDNLNIHFENNNKFLTVKKLERVIEISHWGNIAVEETIDLLHTGALLKGSFSRYDYSREHKSGQSSVQNFDTILPAAATDIYYRDDIGNISTSHTRIKKDSVDVNLRPRFPLFGGWKTHYIIGYNVPSYEYLFYNNYNSEYLLNMRLIDHIFDDMIIDELIVKIILPEGTRNFELSTPYEVERQKNYLHYSYLDTTGRPVISFTKNNLVENHIQNFKLKYNFPRLLMLQEPLLVAIALYLLFLLVIIYVRLDFTIDKDEAFECKLKIASQCEKILAIQDKRVMSYNQLDEQLNYLKQNKDTNVFLSIIKNINNDYKNSTNILNEFSQKIKNESNDIYDKLMELQKYDKLLKEYYNQQQVLYIDKLVPGKINRTQFVDAENSITKKKEECVEKINSIVKSLQ